MRVVAGRPRGRVLRGPAGTATRPTSDRVREAMFSMLSSMDAIEGAPVVDLFAGSGALGIEALSRGAASVTFVDHDRAALAAIRANLAVLGDAGRPGPWSCGPTPSLGPAAAAGSTDRWSSPIRPTPSTAGRAAGGRLAAVAGLRRRRDRRSRGDAGSGVGDCEAQRRYGGTVVTASARDTGDRIRPGPQPAHEQER